MFKAKVKGLNKTIREYTHDKCSIHISNMCTSYLFASSNCLCVVLTKLRMPPQNKPRINSVMLNVEIIDFMPAVLSISSFEYSFVLISIFHDIRTCIRHGNVSIYEAKNWWLLKCSLFLQANTWLSVLHTTSTGVNVTWWRLDMEILCVLMASGIANNAVLRCSPCC